jgi:hypothetical protein
MPFINIPGLRACVCVCAFPGSALLDGRLSQTNKGISPEWLLRLTRTGKVCLYHYGKIRRCQT